MNALIQHLQETEDLVILGFPCNQFGLQEPAKNEEILNTLRCVRPGEDFIPKFELSQKLDVNGKDEHPLFTFLKDVCPGTTQMIGKRSSLYWDTIKQNDITWNFEKFLITKEGKPYKRYAPAVDPLQIEMDIKTLMCQGEPPKESSDDAKKSHKSHLAITVHKSSSYTEEVMQILSKVLKKRP